MAKLKGKIALARRLTGNWRGNCQRLATAGYKVYGTSSEAPARVWSRVCKGMRRCSVDVDVLHAQTKGLHRLPRSVFKKRLETHFALDVP